MSSRNDVITPDPFEMEDLLELLSRGVGTAQHQRSRRFYAHEDGSRAHVDALSIRSTRGFDQGLAVRAYHIAAAQLAAAEDLMLSLEATFYNGNVIGPFALARGALEALGHAFVLLDPKLSANDLAAAAFTSDLWSYHELLRLERKYPSDPDSDGAKDAKVILAAQEKLKHEAELAGFRVVTPDRGEAPFVEKRRPRFAEVLHELMPEGSEPKGFGRVIGAAYSSFAHTNPVLIMSLSDAWGRQITDINQVDSLALNELEVFSLVWPVVVSHLATVERQINAYGWGKSKWQAWSRHARYVIRRYGNRLAKEQQEA